MDKPLSSLTKLVFWLVAANALLGAGALLLFPAQTDRLFFWEIRPPLNAALFGALYLSGAVVVGWVTYRGLWEPARFLIPVLVSAGILISITTLIHLDRFEPGIKLLYWLAIYIGAPLLAGWFYRQHESPSANWEVAEPVTPLTRRIALALGALLLGAGLLILVWPDFVVAQWPWPTSALMLRIFAAWFSAFGVGLLWFLVEHDWGRLHLIPTMMVAASGLDLLVIFSYRADLTASAALWVYCFHLALFGAVGLLMHWLQRRARTAQS